MAQVEVKYKNNNYKHGANYKKKNAPTPPRTSFGSNCSTNCVTADGTLPVVSSGSLMIELFPLYWC